jgi:hypothetical protein
LFLTDSTVDELRNNHLKLMRNVSSDILKLQSALTGKTFAEDALEKGMLLAFEGDLSHQCMDIDCEQLQEICAQHGVFSLPVVQVFFMGQKFIEEVRGFSLIAFIFYHKILRFNNSVELIALTSTPSSLQTAGIL